MNGKVKLFDKYIDNSLSKSINWNDKLIQKYINDFTAENIRNNYVQGPYGNHVSVNLLQSFEDYNIKNMNVAVVGSLTPWIEAMLINMGNKVTTIEYNVPDCNYSKLDCKDYFEFFEKNKNTFDAVVTFSCVEHSGLGRYGDPLDPDGDLKTMECIYNNLKDDAILVWGGPVAKDALMWNAHRVYGEIRLPLIFNKFTELKWYGATKEELFPKRVKSRSNPYQPVVVLKKN